MSANRPVTLALFLLMTSSALPVAAQPTPSTPAGHAPRPAPVLEGTLGWAGFGDEGLIHHGLAGAGARFYVTRRLSIGPEVTYLRGPGGDRDLMVTGNVVFDLLAPAPSARPPRRVTPFLVAGGGMFRHSDTFGAQSFSSTEGGFTVGAGLRTWLTRRTFAAVDARLGWEPHLRVAAALGLALDPR